MINPFQEIKDELRDLKDLVQSLKLQSKQIELSNKQKEELLTVDELAGFLHLSKPTIYSNYSKGLIPGGCKQGKRVLFDKEIILEWVRSGRKLSNAEIEAKAETYLATKKKGVR